MIERFLGERSRAPDLGAPAVSQPTVRTRNGTITNEAVRRRHCCWFAAGALDQPILHWLFPFGVDAVGSGIVPGVGGAFAVLFAMRHAHT